jgi:hypothetical protein
MQIYKRGLFVFSGRQILGSSRHKIGSMYRTIQRRRIKRGGSTQPLRPYEMNSHPFVRGSEP